MSGAEIERLIQLLAKLPGLGPRSARRAALHLFKKRESLMQPLMAAFSDAAEHVRICGTCVRCGAPSTHSERLVATTERIIVGGAKEFVATCGACFRPSRR